MYSEFYGYYYDKEKKKWIQSKTAYKKSKWIDFDSWQWQKILELGEESWFGEDSTQKEVHRFVKEHNTLFRTYAAPRKPFVSPETTKKRISRRKRRAKANAIIF